MDVSHTFPGWVSMGLQRERAEPISLGHPATHDRRQGLQLVELPEIQVRVPGQAVAGQRFVGPDQVRLKKSAILEMSETGLRLRPSETGVYCFCAGPDERRRVGRGGFPATKTGFPITTFGNDRIAGFPITTFGNDRITGFPMTTFGNDRITGFPITTFGNDRITGFLMITFGNDRITGFPMATFGNDRITGFPMTTFGNDVIIPMLKH